MTCLVGLVALILGSCTGPRTPDLPVMENGRVEVLRMEGGDWGYPTPFAHYPRGPGGFKMALIFDSLLERDETGLIPWLAESWEISDMGKTYVFTIRKGVIWHDGKPLTPDDVCFSFNYASKHAATWATVFGVIEQVETLGGNRVRVRVNEKGATLLYALGTCRIIPAHVWRGIENPRTYLAPEALIGTGPYRLTDYSQEHGTYRFEAFDRFWGPQPRVRVLEYRPVGEPILAFEKGEIDLTSVPPDLVPRYAGNPEFALVKSPAFWGYRLVFNMEKSPPLKNTRVRQSICLAINRDELVEKIARGAAVPGEAGILPPGHVMYHKPKITYDFDPAQAVRLLQDQGFHVADGQGEITGAPLLDFHLLISTQEVRMAELIKERLGQVGIMVHLISVDGKTRDARVRDGDYQMAIIGHGGWGQDADYLWSRFRENPSLSPSTSGRCGYLNPGLNVLLDKQHVALDPALRAKLVADIQEILAEDLPELALFYTADYTVYRPATYDGWMAMFDHHALSHSKLSYLDRKDGVH